MELISHGSGSDIKLADGWEVRPIGRIGPLQRGFDLPHSVRSDGPYPVVYSNGIINFHAKAMVKGPGVVTGRSGTLGNVHFVESDYWPHNTSLWVTSFNGFIPRFIYYLYSYIGFERFASGSGVPTLNRNDAHSFDVAIPVDRTEQLAIATALSDVDALLAAQDALIAKKRAIKQGAMQELLTGKRRLPGFSGEWEVKRLTFLLDSPITDGPHLTPRFLDRGVPFLSVNNLVDGRIDWSDLRYISDADHREFSKKCRPRKGDVLFGKAASVGMVAYVDTELEFNIWSPIALIRVDPKFSAKFVFRQLQSKYVEKQVLLLTNSSSQGNIGMRDIERFEIPHPPDREEQVAIAAVIDDFDSEIASLENQRAKFAQLKQGMMQELLTGRIRLV